MNRNIICTSGTSIIGKSIRSLDPQIDISESIRNRIQEKSDSPEFLRKLSAETNSLQALDVKSRDIVSLLVTDTGIGKDCAEELKKVIKEYFKCSVEIKIIKGLQVEDAKMFKSKGISNLFEGIGMIRQRYTMETILNITGGFKSVVPYMALYGLFYGIEVVYLFEFSEHLIKLPPAPLGVDFEKAGKLRTFLIKLRNEGLLVKKEFDEAVDSIPYHEKPWYQSLVCEEEGYVYMSAFGHIIVDAAQENDLQVYLSPSAIKTLEKSSGNCEKCLHSILLKIGNPLWRESHIDPGWTITDLTVSKPGNVEERGAYFIKNNRVNICELYTNHNAYERHLKTRNISDYSNTDFTQYMPTAEGKELEIDFDEDYVQLMKKNKELSEECTDLKKIIDDKDMTWIDLDDKNQTLEKELAYSQKEREKDKAVFNTLSSSFSKRLSFLFTGKQS